jgi:hypothetical protein
MDTPVDTAVDTEVAVVMVVIEAIAIGDIMDNNVTTDESR